jgi:hypothetical protein
MRTFAAALFVAAVSASNTTDAIAATASSTVNKVGDFFKGLAADYLASNNKN